MRRFAHDVCTFLVQPTKIRMWQALSQACMMKYSHVSCLNQPWSMVHGPCCMVDSVVAVRSASFQFYRRHIHDVPECPHHPGIAPTERSRDTREQTRDDRMWRCRRCSAILPVKTAPTAQPSPSPTSSPAAAQQSPSAPAAAQRQPEASAGPGERGSRAEEDEEWCSNGADVADDFFSEDPSSVTARHRRQREAKHNLKRRAARANGEQK